MDCSVKVDSQNIILYRFYEKKTCSSRTVKKSSAMNVDTEVKVVSNDLIKKLMNTSNELGEGENLGAAGKEEIKEPRQDVPTIYVGESSRSIQKREAEHWAGCRSNKTNNHMVYHQTMEHGGSPQNSS